LHAEDDGASVLEEEALFHVKHGSPH
jgi:hypothetical protein